jgi:hypothetical protein
MNKSSKGSWSLWNDLTQGLPKLINFKRKKVYLGSRFWRFQSIIGPLCGGCREAVHHGFSVWQSKQSQRLESHSPLHGHMPNDQKTSHFPLCSPLKSFHHFPLCHGLETKTVAHGPLKAIPDPNYSSTLWLQSQRSGKPFHCLYLRICKW